MDFLVSAIAFLIIFSVIILIHEFGHFYVARKVGIKVEEFGIGIPPRIWGKKIKGTIYSINWIPFGGFVRLYGEDSVDPKLLKDKKSFASKPLRKRMAVVVAGVFLNFVLAFVLLTTGFTIGIEPLLVTADDVINSINSGIIEIDHGAHVKEVEEGSVAYEAGLRSDDIILTVNGVDLLDPQVQLLILKEPPAEEDVFLDILRDGNMHSIRIDSSRDISSFGIELYDVIHLPRTKIRDILPESDSAKAGLKDGDIIISMNDQQVYSVYQYQQIVNRENIVKYEILRNYESFTIPVELIEKQRVTIASIEPDAPAYKAGFKQGDIILTIKGEEIITPEEAVRITSENRGTELTYFIDRKGELLTLKVAPAQNGRIGVGLGTMMSYKNSQLSLFEVDFLTSVLKVNNVKYPFTKAMGHALNESGRLALLTVSMFGDLVRSVVSKLAVPEGVAGPVGIARLTYVFAQQGLLALLRFTALLSLSLAVINIIPFPALDGGRLLFLFVEAIRGKRIPAKWESAINALGFILLIALIFLITYSDILNIFS